MKLTEREMETANEVYQGNFFEGSWMGNEELEKAICAWARKAWPDHYAECNETAVLIEGMIGDEEGRGKLADFVNNLEPALKKEALEGIREDVAGMSPKASILKRLDQVIAAIE